MYTSSSKYKLKNGFSLVEVLVAVAIFSVVMLVAVGALVSIIDLNRKAKTQKETLNNLNSAIESMTRAIRDGTNYYCDVNSDPDATYILGVSGTKNCPPSANVFVFDAVGGVRTAYFASGGQIKRFKGVIAPMTSPGVVIEELTFRTIEYSAVTNIQPSVVIAVKGRAGVSDPSTETLLTLQTTVSQRRYPSLLGEVTSEPTGNPHCPFAPLSNRTIVNFEAEKVKRFRLLCCRSQSLLYTLSDSDPDPNRKPVKPGTYKVYFATWDEHCSGSDCGGCTSELSCPWKHLQPLEHMKMILLQGAAETVAGVSDDIPWDVNDTTTYLGEVTISGGDVDSIRIEHDATTAQVNAIPAPRTQSLVAACVAFDNISSSGDIEIGEF
jgi:prepilin-type N-terminal cleavage/methylation domain-containing protein